MTTAIDAVRNSPLASELSPSEIQVLAGVLTIRELKDGEVLLPEGSVAAIAAPLRPNVSAENDETATTRPEKKRDESRIAKSSDQGG